MADFEFNISKGRTVEFASRIDANDPANSAFIIVVLATSGLEADSVLIDKDTLADVVSGTTNEVTNTNYARKTLTDADIGPFTPTDASDYFAIDVADQTWTSVAAGDGWSKLLVCYDSDTASGTDANIVPCLAYDFVVTPDGSNITAQINANGLLRCT
jgi:hypothetical protein